MKIVCSNQELLSGVNTVSKAVPGNTTMSILQCILIRAESGVIRLTANDTELGIETQINGRIELGGMVAVDDKMLSEAVRKIQDEEITIESDDDFVVHFTSASANFELKGKSADDYTFLPSIEKGEEIRISCINFQKMIRQTVFSIGSSDINPVMSGVDVIISKNNIRFTTLDGNRIAIRNLEMKEVHEDNEVIVPGKTLNEISKIITPDADKEVSLYFTKSHMLMEYEKTLVVSRLIDGNFINVNRMITTEFGTKVTINKKRLSDCLDRSMMFSKEGSKRPIIVDVKDGQLEMRVKSVNGGMDETIRVVKEGNDLTIGFNPKYIFDALKVIDDDEVDMYFINPRSPLYIKDAWDSYIYMVLPINLS